MLEQLSVLVRRRRERSVARSFVILRSRPASFRNEEPTQRIPVLAMPLA